MKKRDRLMIPTSPLAEDDGWLVVGLAIAVLCLLLFLFWPKL